ncbi:UNVERIFIED_CONTAM: putative mitochondrial protein [Sesamum latifolium]|uniref:Mitochondrial protein n=1 Tax=Sesamum latifolium TaxID=2727402 RepID=A0AAW2WS67_9LAMI
MASSLKINLEKSAVVFNSNVNSTRQEELATILGVGVKRKHDKYLGLPSVVGRLKRDVFEGLKDRCWQKLNGWATKKLSQVGRVTLIKSVLQVIPSYIMNCFEIPEGTLKDLEWMMAKFFWHGGGESKIHWIAWHKLCRSKEDGGLDIRRLKETNCALLAKQAWRVAMHKYFPNSNFFIAEGTYSPSSTWSSIARTRDLLMAGLRWRIGNGDSVPVVGVPWLPRPISFQIIRKPKTVHESTKVAALINESG